MRPGSRDLVAFLDEEVLPCLTPADVFPTVKWTSTSGRYWRGPCPIHGGKDPNFSVDSVTKGWTCYSKCGSGSAVAYGHDPSHPITPHGRDFVEAVKKLASRAGVSFPELERTEAEIKRAEEKDRRESLLGAFLAFTQDNLQGSTGAAPRDYLSRRGLTGPALEDLGLYTTREAALAALKSKGFSEEEIKASGVVYDGRWEGRLIIPWRDRWGRLGTFAARDLTGTAEDKEKYLYLSKDHGWGRPKADLVAFGLDHALSRRPDYLLLVEGLLDVVNLQAQGFSNVAAIGGNGRELTETRWAALGVPRVVLLLDNDPETLAGYMGTVAAVENLQKVINTGKVRNVPVLDVVHPSNLGECKDPDLLVRTFGMDALLSVVETRTPAAIFYAAHLLGNVTPESPDHERQEAAAHVAEYAGSLYGSRAALLVEDVYRLTSERTGYSREALEAESKRAAERRQREEDRRRLGDALGKARAGITEDVDPVAVAADLSETLSSMKSRVLDVPPMFSVDRNLQAVKSRAVGHLSSGWASLDEKEIYFTPGELSLIAARPGHCKTTFLTGLLVNWIQAETDPEKVFIFYSQEETEDQVFTRFISRLAVDMGGGWTFHEVRDFLSGGFDSRSREYKWPSEDALKNALDTLRSWENRLIVTKKTGWTAAEIVAHAREFSTHRPIGGVLVDYLQRILPPERDERRDVVISTVARDFKDLAGDLSVPVVMAAQINREAVPKDYQKTLRGKTYTDAADVIKTARPRQENLREGGSEHEADLILGLLSYAADYQADEDFTVPDVTRLDVGLMKNRYGDPGRWIPLAYEGRFNYIRDFYEGEE